LVFKHAIHLLQLTCWIIQGDTRQIF